MEINEFFVFIGAVIYPSDLISTLKSKRLWYDTFYTHFQGCGMNKKGNQRELLIQKQSFPFIIAFRSSGGVLRLVL